MASVDFGARPVRPRHDSEQEGVDSDHVEDDGSAQSYGQASDTNSEDESTSDKDDVVDESEASDAQEEDEEPEPNLDDISFGALAKAQQTFAPKSKKRKLSDVSDNDTPRQRTPREGVPIRDPNAAIQKISRTSKHAPAIQSSRNPVSRRREIFEASPALKFRDPRFDATITSTTLHPSATDQANKNYSFLTGYQATEILELKTQIKKSKDPHLTAQLKRQVMSIEAKIRGAETRQKEREVRRKHQDEERAAIREGKKAKPYYLKTSEVRKQVQQERLDGMGKRARDKAAKRKQKREKGKDARDMPRARRDRTQ